MRTIDLTHELSGRSSVVLEGLDFHSDRLDSKLLATHIEAPAYLMSDGMTLDQFEPGSFVRDAVLLDLTHLESRQPIDDEHLEAAEEGAGLALREGEVVIVRTGWEKFAGREDYWSSHRALSENGAEYLEFKRVVGVAVDTASVDQPGNRTLLVHSILMRSGIFVIENLCNLGKIDQPRFRLIALPPRIRAAVSFVRAVGLLDEGPENAL